MNDEPLKQFTAFQIDLDTKWSEEFGDFGDSLRFRRAMLVLLDSRVSGKNLNTKEFISFCDLAPATAYRLLDNLEAKDLVSRANVANDKRCQSVKMSDKCFARIVHVLASTSINLQQVSNFVLDVNNVLSEIAAIL